MHIAIIGSAGAGKSTFARILADQTQIPVHHLDCLYWKKGWIERTRPEFIEIQQEIISHYHWIIDGNYRSTMDLRLNAADVIIFLNFPRHICLWRAIKRVFLFWNKDRPDITDGCRERIDWEFLKFLQWIWNYPHRSRRKTIQKLKEVSNEKKIYIFHSPTQLQRYSSVLYKKYQKNAVIM